MEEIVLLNNAYKIYNLDTRENLSNDILNYISQRLTANMSSLEKMIEISNLDITFNDIQNTFFNASKENDHYKETSSYKQGADYYSGIFPVPIGNILVETNDVLEVIKYFVKGIKSRNTITISQTEYYEYSLANLILIIFTEALSKFNLSHNTLMILPFEECFHNEFDEIIIPENQNIKVMQKEFSKTYIIYNHDSFFKDEIEKEINILKEKNINYKIIDGNFENAIAKINTEKPEGTVIYTKNPRVAYEFINLTHSQNAFVNTSLSHSEKTNYKHNLYYKKKVIYPSEKNINLHEYFKQYSDSKIQEKNKPPVSDIALTENINPWYKKIKDKFSKN